MKNMFVLPGVAKSWWLVVARKDGLSPLCTVSLGLITDSTLYGEGGIDEVYRRASEVFAPHLSNEERLLVFFFNRSSGEYIPRAEKGTGDPQLEVKFLVGFPWVNGSEELPDTEKFFLGLGIEPHSINRKFAGMAARRAHPEPIPVPFYGC